MPRLRHRASGVIVETSDENAARVVVDFEPVEGKATTDKAPAKKAASRKNSSK